MAIKVKRMRLWSGRIEDRSGGAAAVLEPLAKAKVNLEFVLARRTPEERGKGVIFVAPIVRESEREAAESAGLSPTAVAAALRVEGANRSGVAHSLCRAVADAGISFRGMAAASLGDTFVGYFAFDSEADANRAADAMDAIGAEKAARTA